MDLDVVRVLLFISSLLIYRNGIQGRFILNSSELETKSNYGEPTVKTILNAYGDTYDCVDFYKQPAFDHPLLKNYTSDYKMIPTAYRKRNASKEENNQSSIELEGEGCPIGTVPIRRITKGDFLREKLANGGVHYAVARTKGTGTYLGAGAFISIHNPKVTGQQYSATRIKIQNGAESIEAGWRVDPTLYGDSQTRFFVRTDAGQAHCFNTLCPGFVLQTSRELLDNPFHQISQPGGPVIELRVFISRDQQGNWNLQVGLNGQVVGNWPSRIFTGLNVLASYIEWGGEVNEPNSIPTAQMGSGRPISHRTDYDAYFRNISEYNERGMVVEANDIEVFSDSSYYFVVDERNRFQELKRALVYGGPNH